RDGLSPSLDEYGTAPYTPEQGIESDYGALPQRHPQFDGANSSCDFTYPSPMSASGRSATSMRSPTSQQSPLLLKNHRSRTGTPSSGRGLSKTPPVRWRPNAAVSEDPTKRGSPLARPGTGFTDEGIGSSPQSHNQSPDVDQGDQEADVKAMKTGNGY
ncbi:MAG: hypothetical protein Q9204_007347, partial [Flavoplaca sp. TL-2023a]